MKKDRKQLILELLEESNSKLYWVEGIGLCVSDKIGWLPVGGKRK